MTCIEIHDTVCHTNSKDLATCALQRNSRHTQQTEAKPSFRKVSLLPQKLCMLFHTYLYVRCF